MSRSARLAKRTLDGVVATAALIILSPLLALIAAAIKLTSSGPVIFKQERMGQRGNSFMIWKFRTMVLDAEEQKDLVAHLKANGIDAPFAIQNPGTPPQNMEAAIAACRRECPGGPA